MNESKLLIENFYFKQLLNEEVAFNDQYGSLLGDRTQEFFEYYLGGLNAQKELILALECVDISERILQEKFGDHFAARVAGLGSKATTLVGKLATGAGLGGKLGNWVQNKLDINVDKDGSVAYINARNKNFTRSLGDYLGQLKTFDNTIPDKIGLVPVQKSGWLKGIAQKGGQVLKGGSSLALAGVGLPGAALIGTAFAGANGVQQLTNKLNEVFDVQWKKIQNTQPVQDFDRLFEEKKQSLRNKLSKTDKEGKETSKILQSVDALAEYAKKNPGKSGVIIALMTTTIGLSAGTLGLGILTATQLPILTGAVAFFLRTGLGLLKGESASTAVGGALKAGLVGYLTGKAIQQMGSILQKAIEMGQPISIKSDVLGEIQPSDGGPAVEVVHIKSFTNFHPIARDTVQFFNFNKGAIVAFNKQELAQYLSLQNAYDEYPSYNNLKAYVDFLQKASFNVTTQNYLKSAEIAEKIQSLAQSVGLGVGAAVGSASSVGASGKPPVIKESFKLSDIAKSVMSEAEAAAPGAVPPVIPGNPPVNPDKLSGNQQDAVANLKKNIDKEIRGYIKDVAKTFKVKGKTTTELLDGLRKEPKAKSAVEIIDSILGEFPKYKLEFPKDVVIDDKEAATPPTPATPDGGGGTAPGGGGGGGGTAPGGGGGGGGTAPGGGGGGGGTAPGGGGGGGGTAPGGGGGGGGKTPKPKPGTPDPTTPSTPEPTKPGTPEPAKPGEPEPTKPGTPEPKPAGGTPINLTPVLTKQLTSVKQNPLVAGGLADRIKTMSTLKMSNPTDAKYAKTLLQKIKSVALSNLNKASIQKQLGGNVEQLRKELVKEAMTSADINTFAKELSDLIPLLVNITYGLRQVMNPRLPKTPATPVTEDATYAQPGIEGRGEKNVAADPNVNEKDLKLIKAFLTKLNQLSVSLKTLNVTSPTKEQVKPVIKDILDIFDIINGKLVSGMKVDAQVEALFKDIDLTPTVNIKDGLMLKVKLGNVINIFKFEKGAWSHRQKDGTFVTINPNEKRGKEIFDQLTALAKNGQDDTAQIQKDDEEKAKVDKAKKDSDEEQAKLKKADDDKAAAEKDRKAGIERTKAAAAGTRVKATPKTGSDIVKPGEPLSFDKSKFEENFKSDYKNYF